MAVTTGIVAFSDLTTTELYNGQDTGKYAITVNMEQEEADKLTDAGINFKVYKDQPQRKFVTKFPGFAVLDAEGEAIPKHIPWGSKVRILWEPGKPHPTHGVAPYFKKIKVLEMADPNGMDEDDPDF